MTQRAVVLPVLIVVAIGIGVLVTVQSVNSPVMVRLITQQNEILKISQVTQRNVMQLSARMSPPEGQPGAQAVQLALETRVSDLERRVVELTNVVQQLSGGRDVRQAAAVPQQQRPQEDYEKIYNLPVAHSPVKGNPDAPVSIVMFVDIQCPYSSRFYPVVNEVLSAYPDKVNFVMKHFPLQFHPMAKPAAKAAFAAGEQGKYYEMVQLLLDNFRELSDNKFKELAGKLGLNVDKFMDDFKKNDARYEDLINKDVMLGTQSDVRGTPSFFLGGRKTTARDLASFKTQVDALLKE